MLICHLIYSKCLEENFFDYTFILNCFNLFSYLHHTCSSYSTTGYIILLSFCKYVFYHKYFKRLFIPDLSLRDLDTNISFP